MLNKSQLLSPATTGFGGLPDVTEHSNIRRTLSRQNSISNSDSGGEIASIQKSKVFGSAMTAGVVVGNDIAGIALDTKSPTSLAATASTAAGASGKTKGKSGRKGRNSSGPAHKTRRGSWMFALTLVSAICLLAIAATLAYQHFLMSPSRNSHAQRLRIVRRILREVPLVDGHNNFAWNVRKYAHSSLELVHLSHDIDHKSIWSRPAWAQTDMERLKQGLVGVQVWSAYVPCEAQGLDAVQLALEQIDIVRRLSDMYARETVLATSSQDIVATHRRGLLASLIGIEGGHTIGSSLGVLRSFYSLGARYLSLTHRCDVSWAGSSASPLEQGLSPFGKAIVREMNRLGMMIDLSHSSDATARDVLQVTRAPVIFSHSAARQLCNSTRNVPDDILRLVAENGGLIMLSFDPEDVACGRQARLQDVIEHIKYVRAIAGIQHIGLGAGYDGIEMPPLGLEDVSKYPELLAALLEDHNWSEEDVAMLAGRNFLRIMETVETVRDYWKRAAIQPIEQTEPQPKTQCTYMSS
ncbi:dipeptidase 1-like [Drosophila innubila]|uniref:dipeptidase 1-like n=1 Tax=Drosophila innubila TaxID=198719 RepID=UPI00148C088B|nr:dipeptidase 1-like [Drosophila innubila]